jgi:hypothetical protein
MYEPETGCYIGAGLWDDVRVNGDMAGFDDAAGKTHGISACRMDMGGEFPASRILQAIAAKKLVLLTVDPPPGANPYDEAMLTQTVKDIGRYNIPVFVDFFPYSKNMGYGAESYRRFYRKAWLALREYAPSAAMVWTSNVWDAADAADYYPGDSYTDWVGLHITADISKTGEYNDFMTAFEEFYALFQDKKPIMLASLSLSHFSTIDNTYRTGLCGDTLSAFYERVAYHLPRVKAIVYQSYDNVLEPGRGSKARNNYLITGDDALIRAYREAVADKRFLSGVSETDGDGFSVKSPENAAIQDGILYITADSAETRLNNKRIPGQARDVLGQKCYPAEAISAGGADNGSFDVDNENMVVRWRQ